MLILLSVYNKWKPIETLAISKSWLNTIDHKTKQWLITPRANIFTNPISQSVSQLFKSYKPYNQFSSVSCSNSGKICLSKKWKKRLYWVWRRAWRLCMWAIFHKFLHSFGNMRLLDYGFKQKCYDKQHNINEIKHTCECVLPHAWVRRARRSVHFIFRRVLMHPCTNLDKQCITIRLQGTAPDHFEMIWISSTRNFM